MLKQGSLYKKLYRQDSRQSMARLRRESFAGVIALSLRFEYLLNDALADTGLTTMQVMVMATIMRESEPPSLSTLASRLKVSQQNIKQMARLLEEKGFIDMERDPADRRAYRLIPTEYSDRVFEDRLEADARQMSRMFEVLTNAEQKQFFELLGKLLDHNNGLYDELKMKK